MKGFFYGYKIQVVVNRPTDLPVALEATAGNVYDGNRLPLVLRNAVRINHKHPNPKAVITDKRCDAGYNYVRIVEEIGAAPITAIRRGKGRVMDRQSTPDDFLPEVHGKRFFFHGGPSYVLSNGFPTIRGIVLGCRLDIN